MARVRGKSKITFFIRLSETGGIDMEAVKHSNRLVSKEEVLYFFSEAHERLNKLEESWTKMYDKEEKKHGSV